MSQEGQIRKLNHQLPAPYLTEPTEVGEIIFTPCISSRSLPEPGSTYGVWPKSVCGMAAFRGALVKGEASGGHSTELGQCLHKPLKACSVPAPNTASQKMQIKK